MKITLILVTLFLGLFCTSHDIIFHQPPHFPPPVYDFVKNPLSLEKVELGRMLFHDPILSKDNSISCASCHSPYNAFAHTDHRLSHGIDDQIGTRNAPALFNLAWQNSFMWDGRVDHIDEQPATPITDKIEMNESFDSIIVKLEKSSIYKRQFDIAFQDSVINQERIEKALSAFQLTLVSAGSKYDLMKKGKEVFTEQENKGYDLFQSHCNTCHLEPLFSNYTFKNNGLPIDTTLHDTGRGGVTSDEKDMFKFKVPSLRNLSYTYPYMHDGRFQTLNEILNHYRNLEQNSQMISIELIDGIDLTDHDKADLIAFLLTLNDKDFVFDPGNKFPREKLLSSEGISK